MKQKIKLSFVLSVVAVLVLGGMARAQVGMTLPSVPGSVSATLTPPSQVSVSWAPATESSGTIEGYYVYRNGGQIANTAGTSIVDSVPGPGLYDYTVAAYDANNNTSAQSSPVASVTVLSYTTPPTTPTDVTITGATTTDSFYQQVPLTISWGASSDNIGVAGYNVYRNGVAITPSTSTFTGTSITDTVSPGTYSYTVVAYDAAQNYSPQSLPATITISIDSNPPSTPTKVTVQQVSASGVNLSWSSSTDSIGVAGYQIYRDGVQIASAGGPPYADTGLSAGTNLPYTYTVTAYDAAGNISQPSAPVQIVLQQTNGPSAPYLISATFLGTSTVQLSWSPGSDVLAITGYTVYRDGAQVASVTSTSYSDEGLATGTYQYVVSETDVSGAVSPTSSSMSVLVPVVTSVPSTTTPPVVTAPTGSQPSSGTSTPIFTQFLYFGLRSAQVGTLQSFLVQHGYLSSVDVTGFFGNLTLHAVQKFQCDQGIVCAGGLGSGTVGPKTRNALNELQGNTASSSSGSSSSALIAEIQALQAELVSLEKQASSSTQ